jgi:hypothetical protein
MRIINLNRFNVGVYSTHPSSIYYKFVKYNTSILYQRWIRATNGRLYEIEKEKKFSKQKK